MPGSDDGRLVHRNQSVARGALVGQVLGARLPQPEPELVLPDELPGRRWLRLLLWWGDFSAMMGYKILGGFGMIKWHVIFRGMQYLIKTFGESP